MVFADEIPFAFSGNSIGQEEIDEIDDFPGKKDFIRFYTIHNGGDFIDGAWFYPQTGEIKYIDFQMSTNPKDVITVASSFREFCQHIKRRGR